MKKPNKPTRSIHQAHFTPFISKRFSVFTFQKLLAQECSLANVYGVLVPLSVKTGKKWGKNGENF